MKKDKIIITELGAAMFEAPVTLRFEEVPIREICFYPEHTYQLFCMPAQQDAIANAIGIYPDVPENLDVKDLFKNPNIEVYMIKTECQMVKDFTMQRTKSLKVSFFRVTVVE